MKYSQIEKEIRNNCFHPVYLLTGKEIHIAEMLIKQIRNKTIDPMLSQINEMIFDTSDFEVNELLSLCNTPPIGSDKRMVLVKESSDFMKINDTDQIKKIAKYLSNPAPDTILIIVSQAPDKRKKIYKEVAKASTVVDFNKLNRVELEQWIQLRFSKNKIDISKKQIAQFINASLYLENKNKNMEMIDHEIEKIIDYIKPATHVTEKDLVAVLPKSIDDNIFNMIDLALVGNKGVALEMLKQFYLEGESPFGVFALLVRQIRLLIQVKVLTQENFTQNQISEKMKVKPFIVGKIQHKTQRFSSEKLLELHDKAANLDYQIKSGKIDAQFGVEWLMLSI